MNLEQRVMADLKTAMLATGMMVQTDRHQARSELALLGVIPSPRVLDLSL